MVNGKAIEIDNRITLFQPVIQALANQLHCFAKIIDIAIATQDWSENRELLWSFSNQLSFFDILSFFSDFLFLSQTPSLPLLSHKLKASPLCHPADQQFA